MAFQKLVMQLILLSFKTFAGTPLYMSPQILEGIEYSFLTDIWSLGIIFFQMLYGRLPFKGNSINDLYEKIQKNKEIKFPEIPKIDSEIKILIKRMLSFEESNRIKWDQLQNHELFKEEENKKDYFKAIDGNSLLKL